MVDYTMKGRCDGHTALEKHGETLRCETYDSVSKQPCEGTGEDDALPPMVDLGNSNRRKAGFLGAYDEYLGNYIKRKRFYRCNILLSFSNCLAQFGHNLRRSRANTFEFGFQFNSSPF